MTGTTEAVKNWKRLARSQKLTLLASPLCAEVKLAFPVISFLELWFSHTDVQLWVQLPLVRLPTDLFASRTR